MSKTEYTKNQLDKSPSRFNKARLKNRLVSIFTNPMHLISIAAIIFLIYTIVVPLYEMVSNTVTYSHGDLRVYSDAEPGKLTFKHWVHMLTGDISKNVFYKPIFNSINVAVWVSIFSALLGGTLAWLVTRSDIPFKKSIAFMAIIPYMLPSWMKSMAWLVIFKNDRIGGNPGLIQSVFGVSPPDWLSYGAIPIIVVLVAHYFTFFYLLIAVALSSINSGLEETADILGAKRGTILRRITFPLVLPAILSAFILTFSKSMGTFGPAAFLGLPVKYYTIATMLYSSIRNRMEAQGYILSLVLIMIAAITIYINQRAIGKRKGYTTVGGKDARKTLTPLGRWRKPIFTSVMLFMFSAGIFPLLMLFLQSFMLKEGVYTLDNFTTHFWAGASDPHIASGEVGVFMNSNIKMALKNSLIVAFSAAGLSALIGVTLGYIIAKGRKSIAGKVIEQLSFIPYLIPGIAFAAIYISLFAKPGFLIPALYGTLTIIILITVVKDLPFATRSGTSSMMQISGELEEAAKIQGASFFKRFTKIMLPLTRKGIISAFLLGFIGGMKELDLIILLVTPKTGTLTTLTFQYAESGYQQFSNAITVIVIVIIMVTYFVATKWGKADLTKGIGG
ncbi:MAG: ABC transporter permease [Candidatus Pristimantibacillus sp.]